MAYGLNGISQEKAVFQALNELGDQTSLSVLKNRAEEIYGNVVTNISRHKTYWRIKKGINRDNRTYASQPRRNMLKDSVPKKLQQRVNQKLNPQTKRTVLLLLRSFHSKQQLQAALRS